MEASGAAAATGEVGWYVLGPNQETVGPYALTELRGEHLLLSHSNYVHFKLRIFSLKSGLGFSPR